MRRLRVPTYLAFTAAILFLSLAPAPPRLQGQGKTKGNVNHQGLGVVIELDKEFITKYAHKATMTTEFTIDGISAVHPPKNDGEVHIGGWSDEAGLACVSEIMNAKNAGKTPLTAVRQALKGKQKVTFTGAWRLWAEHAGTGPQIQDRQGAMPDVLPGEYPSNPDHVFEIHPVTSVTIGKKTISATDAIGETPGFTPYDAQTAFEIGYEKLPCKIVDKGDRVRITTEAARFNFARFMIRLAEDPFDLGDGHGVICSVYDTDGEFVLKNRRMVFVKGTEADDLIQGKKTGDRLKVVGIPRFSLMLIQWRLEHQKDKGFDINPLEWRLPYEMIIVAAAPVNGAGD
jgi:hypothetical protein